MIWESGYYEKKEINRKVSFSIAFKKVSKEDILLSKDEIGLEYLC